MSEHFSDEEFYEYLDGELVEMDARRLRVHIKECAQCRQQLAQAEQLFARVESLPELALERDLAPEILQEIEAQEGMSRSLPWWIAAEALAALAVLVGWLIGQPSLSPGLRQAAEALNLFLLWNQWAWPQRTDLLQWFTALPDQVAELFLRMDPSRLWKLDLALPWAVIITVLIVLWLLGNSLLLADQYYRLHPFDEAQRRKGANHG
ncbi:MAG: anti-sigma factor family protein [Anaerolineales bacterium]